MEKIVAVRFGMEKAHDVNEAWFAAIGIQKSYPFNIFTSRKLLSFLGPVNQLFGVINNLFLPKADLYLLTSLGCTISVVFKKKLFNRKIISITSDTFFRDLDSANWLKKKYMLWLVKHIDAIIATSEMMKELACKYTSVPVQVVYPYCDTTKFLKIKPDYTSKNLCSIGIGTNTKGTDLLLETFATVQQTIPESKLFVPGDTAMYPKISEADGVIAPGITDIVPYLTKSSLYLNTSRHESFGVNILEAMSSALPVIVTDHCGAAEIVRKVDKSLVVSVNSKVIAEKAISLLNQPKKLALLGEQCRKEAKKYTKEKSCNEFKKAFTELTAHLLNS